jgi:hypothetical protein
VVSLSFLTSTRYACCCSTWTWRTSSRNCSGCSYRNVPLGAACGTMTCVHAILSAASPTLAQGSGDGRECSTARCSWLNGLRVVCAVTTTDAAPGQTCSRYIPLVGPHSGKKTKKTIIPLVLHVEQEDQEQARSCMLIWFVVRIPPAAR